MDESLELRSLASIASTGRGLVGEVRSRGWHKWKKETVRGRSEKERTKQKEKEREKGNVWPLANVC